MQNMKDTPELWEQVFNLLSQYKEQGILAGLAGTVAVLRSMYNGGGWKKTLLDGVMCAFFGWFAKDLLAFVGVNPDFAYLASVFIGYLGVETLSKILKGKAGVRHD
ncbi:phage holin, lambda family [Providencia rettgeri]